MDIGIEVACSRCLTQFQMYTQTHAHAWKNGKPMVGGMCPHCNAYTTAIMKPDKIFFYPPERINDNI